MALGQKTGGRQRGSKNKRTLEIEAKLAKLGCDPIEGMALIAMDEDLDTSLRLAAYKELAQYVAPKRKALDVNADFGLSHEAWLEQLR